METVFISVFITTSNSIPLFPCESVTVFILETLVSM